VDVVVAVRNEEETLPSFLDGVSRLEIPESVEVRLVFIEDSSTDRTRDLLREVAQKNPSIGYYFLERGFGQGPAVVFGVSRSCADAVIMMDADGTHPIDAIPALIAAYLRGRSVVQCVRRSQPNRQRYRNVGATVFQRLTRLLTGVNVEQQNIYFRLLSAAAAAALLLRYPQYWQLLRFPLPLAEEHCELLQVGGVERTAGSSKYGILRLVRLAIDGMLALVGGIRGILLLSILVLAAAIAGAAGHWPTALLLILVTGGLVARFLILRSDNPLNRMVVVEAANVDDARSLFLGSVPVADAERAEKHAAEPSAQKQS
jgi:polyisoprenyl-phosphate glycosyltransferase